MNRIVLAQFVVAGLAAGMGLVSSGVAAMSGLLGGLTCALPGWFMVWRFGREVADPGLALSHLVRGEAGKLGLTTAMMIAIFSTVEVIAPGYFFSALAAGLLCNALVPLFASQIEERRRVKNLSS